MPDPAVSLAAASADAEPSEAALFDAFLAGDAVPEAVVATPEAEVTAAEVEEPEASAEETEEEAEPAETDDTAAATGDEITFQLPAWAADASEEFKTHLTKLGSGLLEQTAKLKRQRSTAERERDDAKSETETVKTELEQLRNAPPAIQDQNDPLALLKTPAELDTYVAGAQAALDFATGALEHMEDESLPEITHGDRTFTRAEMRALKARATATLSAAPQRRSYLALFAEAHTLAQKAHPALFAAGSPEAKALTERLKREPALARVSDHEVLVGDNLTMSLVRAGKKKLIDVVPLPKGTATPVKTKQPAPATVAASTASAPTAKPGGNNDTQALLARANDGDAAAEASLLNAFMS